MLNFTPLNLLFAPWSDRYVAGFQGLPVALQYAFVIILGLIVGSFLTVVVHRLPVMLKRAWHAELVTLAQDTAMEWSLSSSSDQQISPGILDVHTPVPTPYNLWTPRSSCPSCGYRLRPFDNIPLFSYLALRGHCAHCSTRISLQYPALEMLTGLFAALVFWRYGVSWYAVTGFSLSATLLVLAFIDANTRLLPDSLTLPLLWAGLLINLQPTFAPLADAVIGAAAGYLSLWLVYWVFWLFRGKEGLGYGDFKLLAALGAWFGWTALMQIILFASVTGAAFGLVMLARKRLLAGVPLPFGPFIAAAGLFTLLDGNGRFTF